MIKFFHQIRQSMIDQNRAKKCKDIINTNDKELASDD